MYKIVGFGLFGRILAPVPVESHHPADDVLCLSLRDWSSGRFQSFSRVLIIVSGKVSPVVNSRDKPQLYKIVGYNSRKRPSHRVYKTISYNRRTRGKPQTLPNQ